MLQGEMNTIRQLIQHAAIGMALRKRRKLKRKKEKNICFWKKAIRRRLSVHKHHA
jgi:hypothetical protein